MYHFNDNRTLCASFCFCNQDVGDLSRNRDIVGGAVSGLGEGQCDLKITEMEKKPFSSKMSRITVKSKRSPM